MSHDARIPNAGAPSDLFDRLVGELEPVRPVRLARIAVAAAALEVAAVAATALLSGVRFRGLERVDDPMFLGLLAMLAAGALAGAATMAWLSIPGRSVNPVVRVAVLALPLVLALLAVAISPWGGTWTGFAAVVVEGFHCTSHTLLIALPAWIAGLLFLRRLAPMDAQGVGLFASSTALLTSAVVVQMACPNCDSWHLALSHYSPILVAAWLGAMAAPLVLHRPPRG